MKYLADQLPPEIAKQLHPDRRKNEIEYWAARDQLLEKYRDQWIGFADGKVVASGRSPVEVLHASEATGLHPFFTCVGREHEPDRIRRVSFPYNTSYSGEPVPRIDVEFRRASGSQGVLLDRVLPDTGADVTILPWVDCQTLQMDLSMGIPRMIRGIGGAVATTLAFQIWVFLDGQERQCRLQIDFAGTDRILGRDVLNRMDVLFRGPAGEVVFNP